MIFIAELVDVLEHAGPKQWGNEAANFRLLETLKGGVDFPTIQSGPGNCRVPLEVGGKYLVFTSDGRVGRCGGTARLQDRLHYVRAISLYQSGATQRLIEPWGASSSRGFYAVTCTLSTNIDRRGRVKIQASIPAEPLKIVGSFVMWLPNGLEFESEDARLSIDGIHLMPGELTGTYRLSYSRDEFDVLIGKLSANSTISLSPDRQTSQADESLQSAHWSVPTHNFEHALPKFLGCYDRLNRLVADAQKRQQLPK